jgi:hypothetical protein
VNSNPADPRSPLDREPTRTSLLQDCARGEMSLHAMARKYGAAVPAIWQFRRRWAEAILALVEDVVSRAMLDDHWVSNVKMQVAHVEDLIDRWDGEIRSLDAARDAETITAAEHADRAERATKLILSAHKTVAALEGRLGAGAVAAPELPVAYVLAVEVAD